MTPPAELPVAVLDSSVLVPVWSRLILQRLAGRAIPPYAPVWSEWIIAETWRTLALLWVTRRRPQASLDAPGLTRQANQMLRYLLPVMRFVSLRDYAGLEPWHELTDPDDAPVWQTAVLAKANYVVSHNTRHFPPLRHGRHAYGGIDYLTAIEFIEDVLNENAETVYLRPLPLGAAIRSGRSV